MSQAAKLKAKIFNTVTGTEDIPSELLKCVAELQLSKQQLTVYSWQTEQTPSNRNNSRICANCKKDEIKCENYICFSLLCTPYGIFTNKLLQTVDSVFHAAT